LRVDKFVEGPFGEFHRHIVKRWLKRGKGIAGNGVYNFVESITDGDLGRYFGDEVVYDVVPDTAFS